MGRQEAESDSRERAPSRIQGGDDLRAIGFVYEQSVKRLDFSVHAFDQEKSRDDQYDNDDDNCEQGGYVIAERTFAESLTQISVERVDDDRRRQGQHDWRQEWSENECRRHDRAQEENKKEI